MNAFQNIILDLVIAAVLVFATVRGAKRGFVLMLASFLKVIIALVGSVIITHMLAPVVANAVQPAIEERILPPLMEIADETGRIADASLEAVSEINVFGFRLGDYLDRGAEGTVGQAGGELAASAAGKLSAEIADTFARFIVSAASFFLVLIAVAIAAHALDLAFRLPLLGGINHALGLLLGAVSGLLIVLLFVTVAELFVSPEVADNTVLFSFFRDIDPFSLR